MTDYRSRNQILLLKPEAASGTEETPTVGSNALRVRNLRHTTNFDNIDTNYHQGSLSNSAPIIGGGMAGFSFEADLKGSGAGATAPELGAFLRACGFQEVTTGAAVTGTAQAGAASTITLASGASSTDNIYVGMPIYLTGGTGDGQVNVISGYVGSTKVATVAVPWANLPGGTAPDNTTTYSIPANNLYRPISAGLETVTGWAYQNRNSGNSRLRKLKGAAGTFQLRGGPRTLMALTGTLSGILPGAPADVSAPSSPTYQAQEARPIVNAASYLGGAAVKFNEYSLDLAATVAQFDDPSQAYGYDYACVVSRAPTGRLVPNLTLTSSRDAYADFLASTSRSFWLNWGTAAGNRVSLFHPALRYTGNEEADVRGFAAQGIPFRAVQPDGEIYLCFH